MKCRCSYAIFVGGKKWTLSVVVEAEDDEEVLESMERLTRVVVLIAKEILAGSKTETEYEPSDKK